MLSDITTAHDVQLVGSVRLQRGTVVFGSLHCNTLWYVSMVQRCDSRKSRPRIPSVVRPSAITISALNTVVPNCSGSLVDPKTVREDPSTLTRFLPVHGISVAEGDFTRSQALLWRIVTAAPVSRMSDTGLPKIEAAIR